MAVKEDITERKRTDENLRESRENFQRYFNMSTVGMGATSPDRRWIETNGRLRQKLGYCARSIVKVYSGTFSNNIGDGLELTGSILNEHIIPACNGNSSGCYNASPNATPMSTVNNVTVEADIPGGWKLALNAIGSATDPEDGRPSIDCTPALGSLLPVGTATIVSCAVKDNGGLTDTDSGTVHVVDTAVPVLSLPANMTFAIIEVTTPGNYTLVGQ